MGEEGIPKTELIEPALLDGLSANFIVKGPNGQQKAYSMKQLVVTVGRSEQCDIAVKDGSMSGKHAEFSKIDGEIRVRDLGSANGLWLNGERVDDVELYDGDVLRCGQTSIRVDVVGGRKRPVAGMPARILGGIVVAVVVLAAVGFGVGITLKKRAQRERDVATVSAFVNAAREGQKAKPCAAAVDDVLDVARALNTLGKTNCTSAPKGETAKRLVLGYRDLAGTYDRIAASISQLAAGSNAASAALRAAAQQIEGPDLKSEVAEAQALIDERSRVTESFISDWKNLAQATSRYANQLDLALVQGDSGACAEVDKGIAVRSAPEALQSCNKKFDSARDAVEEKLQDLDDVAFGSEQR